MSKILRPYQSDAIKAVEDKLSKGVNTLLLVLATGLGKTVTAVKTADKFKSTLFVVDSEELLEQAALAFLRERFDDSLIEHIQKIGFVNYVRDGGLFAATDYKVGLIKADVFQPYGNVVFCSAQTLHRRLDKLPKDLYDLVIVDEAHCFPKGTLVDGRPIETIKKGDFVRSYSHDKSVIEYKEVTQLFKHKYEGSLIKIKLSNGIEFTCTENHPIYTQEYGYLSALLVNKFICTKQVSCLYLSLNESKKEYAAKLPSPIHENKNKAVYSVRENLCSKKQYGLFVSNLLRFLSKTAKRIEHNNLLQHLWILWENIYNKTFPKHFQAPSELLSRMSNKWKEKTLEKSNCHVPHLWNTRSGNWKGGISKSEKQQDLYLCFKRLSKKVLWNRGEESSENKNGWRVWREVFNKNENEKSYVDGGGKRENDCQTEGKNFFSKRREWTTYQTSINDVSSHWTRDGIRHTNTFSKRTISEPSNGLQSGFGRPISETSNRDRWEYSQAEEMEVFGQKENRDFERVRVESAEILEQGSRDFNEQMCEENYVYNIGVEDNHNYFVNNTLVHNCFMAASYFRGITHFTPRLRLGLTATPQRLDNLPLSDLFSEIAYEYNIDAGIKDGYLVELNAIRIKTNCSLDSVKTLGGEFNQKDLSNEINTPARNNQIADSYLKYCSGRKALGFGIDITHCLDMAEAFKQKGINAEAISSDESRTGDRDAQWKAYQQNKIDVLFNVGLLTKGVDSPETSCIITSRPTKSISLYMQIIGRGTRTLPGVINGLNSPEERILAINKSAKKDCIILDIVDSTTRHSLINAWELDKQKPIEDRTFVNKENKDKLLLDRISRSVKLQHTRNSDEKVNLLSLPKLKISTSYKMEEDATMAQLAAIERWNYPMDVHYTKSMIVEIFGKQPATAKHISFLKWKGYDVSGFVSVAEATAASREINAREEKAEREKNQNNIKNNLPFKF